MTTPGGTDNAEEREFYTQLELVGTYRGLLGDDWALHPTLGVSYQSANVTSNGVAETNLDGSIGARAVFQKAFCPGTFVPNVTARVEHLYQSTLGERFLDDATYGIIGVGGQFAGEVASFNVALKHRAGFNGNRKGTVLVTGVSFDF